MMSSKVSFRSSSAFGLGWPRLGGKFAVVFGLVLGALALGCGSSEGWDGAGRGPAGGGGGTATETPDDLGGVEVPPDPQFDEAVDDPPADPGE